MHAARAPQAIAVTLGDARLTYGELNARANKLARHLRAHGVGPETTVGVMLPRSLDTVVALMAVLKAGGAYVPMDPNYPVDRLAYILEDSCARVLVTNGELIEQVSGLSSRPLPPLVRLDQDRAAIEGQDAADFSAEASLDNLAYIIYTSGSTGRPKGTMVAHANLDAAYAAWEEAYGLRDRARVHLQMASVSFDVFTGDLVRALCSGGTLVLVPHDLLFAPDRLLALMRAEHVDSAEFVPAVMRDLINYLDSDGQRIDFMRLLVVGSDSWYAKEYAEIRRFCGPETRLVNSYGVTEATIDSTYYETAALDMAPGAQVPIGRPFPGVELYLLDQSLRLAPVGAPGELYIGGTGVTRGYLRRPDLTAERFVPHPFSDEPGARLYRTGDLVRFLPGGQISFLGRADHQVKLRGFRIELAEVEAALTERPEIAAAAAAIKEDAAGDRRLFAYVVAAPGAECSASELRRYLRARMPEHMVPSAVVVLDALPLTPNGKIDRAALPQPDAARQTDDAFVAPTTELERTIAAVWQDVLGVPKVGIHDSFFDLGGHSLLLLRLQSRLRQTLDRSLSVLDLFQYPTVHTLATFLGGQRESEARAVSDVQDRVGKQREALRRQREARAPRAVTT